jgi:Domain of unknown function (DUF4381)
MNAPLDKLHDFYQPPPPAWTPQTAGWYVVFAIVGVLVLWLVVRSARKWYANRYRREALRELATASPAEFSVLLKRTALAAWPRAQVASLSGTEWLAFLNQTSLQEEFLQRPGNQIEEVGLRPIALSPQEERTLRQLTVTWIRRHRVQA